MIRPEPRVVIVAENAWARNGGEPMLPLHYFRLLRKRGVEAWLVVHQRAEADLTLLLPAEKDRIFYVCDTPLQRRLFRLGKKLPHRVHLATTNFLSEIITQRHQRQIVRRIVREQGANVVHQPTPVSPRQPSLIHRVGAPVVMGPMNGGMEYPPGFRNLDRRSGRRIVALGRRFSQGMNRLMPGKLRASVLLVANPRTRRALPRGSSARIIELVENGIDPALWRPVEPGHFRRPGPVRFYIAARLVDWKAVDILLEAFARVSREIDARLDILGDGEMLGPLRALASQLGIAGRVTFHGFLPQEQCASMIRGFDALVLPSLFECGGAVVLEAMATGLPVIASNWGGPADYVDSATGILVDPLDRAQFIDALTKAMLRLARNPDLRRRMGEAGRAKVIEHFNWDRKIDVILAIYREAIGGTTHAAPTTPAQLADVADV